MGRHSLRWLLLRVKHLPPDAAVWQVQAEPEPRVTSNPNEIAAFFAPWFSKMH